MLYLTTIYIPESVTNIHENTFIDCNVTIYGKAGSYAEDFAEEEDSFEILTSPEDFSAVREALEAEQITMVSAEVTMVPQNYVELTTEEDIKKINKILDLLDEDDDVQAVYHNWDE